ncbi:phosphoadenosine phosphosulfate reductase domain-containing protein [Mycobacteroides abscessus]|uniref:phosphoadenosine phosphosulfate reductase domain-containing protein n=1 Tax=Mycobacteroides abscessus TaxID=36809 RepID=UPI002B4B9E0C|nr:phosphoadenosine phosphosulfate reductase family protein [Mycobacteroides abscessus]
MSGATLFDASEVYSGDPLAPDLVSVTPPELVGRLTGTERELRVKALIAQAHSIVDRAWEIHSEGKRLAASCVLFSGGNDSTVLTHLMRARVDYAVHANTTIGIEQTRQSVRDTCATWGIELLERVAPTSYRELVIERGFPGPAMHYKMYQRLKERCLDQVQRELVKNPRSERVLFIAGRRRSESRRRHNVPFHERRGSRVWASPLAMWTKLDMNTYRMMCGDVPVNDVSELLHMSGECLCGAFAKENELDEIRFWFPDVAAEIDELEHEVKAAGHVEPFCRWGHRAGGEPPKRTGMLCSSCEYQGSLF